MKNPLHPLVAACLLAGALPAFAQAPATAADTHADHHTTAPGEAASELSEGEITRLDAKALKLTLRHGELKNLNMPPMTMVFRVQDAALLAALNVGDRVRFRAEQIQGGYYVTRIEKAP